MDIVLVGFVGLSESLRVAKEKEESLKARFPQIFFDNLLKKEKVPDFTEILKYLTIRDLSYISLGDGGLYRGLWDLGETFNCGISVRLKDVNVLQEVVELTEFCSINPYSAHSHGAVLVRTEDGGELVNSLLALGIESSVIGNTTKGNDRVVFYDENVLYLTPYKEED